MTEIDEIAAAILAAEEDAPEEWARKALGIGEDLEHDGDCTKHSYTCRLCAREEYQHIARAALAVIVRRNGQ